MPVYWSRDFQRNTISLKVISPNSDDALDTICSSMANEAEGTQPTCNICASEQGHLVYMPGQTFDSYHVANKAPWGDEQIQLLPTSHKDVPSPAGSVPRVFPYYEKGKQLDLHVSTLTALSLLHAPRDRPCAYARAIRPI